MIFLTELIGVVSDVTGDVEAFCLHTIERVGNRCAGDRGPRKRVGVALDTAICELLFGYSPEAVIGDLLESISALVFDGDELARKSITVSGGRDVLEWILDLGQSACRCIRVVPVAA